MTRTNEPEAEESPRAERPILTFGHPRGLLYFAATELWERISFHGMQALLVLYMVEQLLLPGHVEHIAGFSAARATIEAVTGPLSTQALASQIFGLYVGLIGFTPVFGGLVGDRVLGRVGAVTLGGLLVTAGHFSLTFDPSFLLALAFLVLGTGLLRGNLAPQVGELYETNDGRRASGFQIYYSMVSLGLFLAPVITGLLGKAFGWHVAFGFAGFGMLLGLGIYLSGRKHMPKTQARGRVVATSPLTRGDWRVIVHLLVLVPMASLFWVAQSQVWNTYNLWVRDHIELQVGSFSVPVPWLQSLDGLAPFALVPLVLVFWKRQAARGAEPDELVKMAIGCFIFASGTAWLAGAGFVVNAHGRTSLLWPVVFHIVSNLGWLYFAPTAVALFSRAAPKPVNATIVGLYFFSVFFGSVASGRLGGLYERVSPARFWAIHAVLCAAGGAMLLAYRARLNRVLNET